MCLACGVKLQAQDYTPVNVDVRRSFRVVVNAIIKIRGFVWLGTDNCLDRFEEQKVRHFEFRGIESGRKKR